ncbi:MAG: hypothetical protein FWF28_06760 [Micrococcales bacterium]|nr:hypothetical protein [Micrococcales bacterium]
MTFDWSSALRQAPALRPALNSARKPANVAGRTHVERTVAVAVAESAVTSEDWTGWYRRSIPMADDLYDDHLDRLRREQR